MARSCDLAGTAFVPLDQGVGSKHGRRRRPDHLSRRSEPVGPGLLGGAILADEAPIDATVLRNRVADALLAGGSAAIGE